MAGRLLEVVAGGDNRDEGLVAEDGDRGGLTFELHEAGGPGRFGSGDVDDAQPLLLGVGIGQQLAVLARGNDLGHGLLATVAPFREVVWH